MDHDEFVKFSRADITFCSDSLVVINSEEIAKCKNFRGAEMVPNDHTSKGKILSAGFGVRALMEVIVW